MLTHFVDNYEIKEQLGRKLHFLKPMAKYTPFYFTVSSAFKVGSIFFYNIFYFIFTVALLYSMLNRHIFIA